MKYMNFKGVALFSLLYIFILFIQYFNVIALIYAFLVIGIIFLFLRPKVGVYYTIITLFLFDDLPYNLELQDNFASIHTSLIFGQTTSKVLMIILLGLVIIKLLWKLKREYFTSGLIRIMLILGVTAITTGIIKGNIFYFSEYINDLRFFLNFFIGFFLIQLFLNEKERYQDLMPALSSIFIAKVFSILILAIILSKSTALYKITTDTGFYLMIFFIQYYLIVYKEKRDKKFWALLGIITVILALGLSASRGRMVIVIISLGMFLYATKNFSTIPKLAAACFIGLSLIPVISPEMYNYLLWKMTSFNPEEGAGESALVRYVEFANIINHNLNNISSFFFGKGLGGYWTSDYMSYPFSLYGSSSYPDEWIKTDKFFKPHGIVQFLLLKVGVIGTILFYGTILKLFFKSKKFFKNNFQNSYKIKVLISISAGLLPFYLVAFSSKLQFFGGILFGLWYCYFKNLNSHEGSYSC